MGTRLIKNYDLKSCLEEIGITDIIENPKVSIIVPTYNNEKFLEKCLESLIKQTLKEIDIIVVNDGSEDNTKGILDIFERHDSRIKVIHQSNQKQGAARNRGMEIAKGEYVGFVDSDDWVDLDYFEKLYNAAKKYNSDIALATNIRIGNGKTKKRLDIKQEEFVIDMQGKFDICHIAKNPCPTNKIYKREMLIKNNIKWPEGCYCEDKLFVTQSVYYASGVVTVPEIYYYYFRNPDSTVNSTKGKHNKVKRSDRDNARRAVLDFLIENNAQLRDKDFWAIKKDFKLFGILLYRVKESFYTEKHYIFGVIPFRYCKKSKGVV